MGTYFYYVIETRPTATAPWTAVYNSHDEEGQDRPPHPLAHLHLPFKCYGIHPAFRELERLHAVPPPPGWHGPDRCFPDDATAAARAATEFADSRGWAFLEELDLLEQTDAWVRATAEDPWTQGHRAAFVERVRPGLRALATGPHTVRMVWGFS